MIKTVQKQRLNFRMRKIDEQVKVSNDLNNVRYLICIFHITGSYFYLVFNYKFVFFLPLLCRSSVKSVHNWPFVSAVPMPADSTNQGSKIFGKKS